MVVLISDSMNAGNLGGCVSYLSLFLSTSERREREISTQGPSLSPKRDLLGLTSTAMTYLYTSPQSMESHIPTATAPAPYSALPSVLDKLSMVLL